MNALRGMTLACLTMLVLVGMADGTTDQTNANRSLWTVYNVENTSMASWHLTEIYEGQTRAHVVRGVR